MQGLSVNCVYVIHPTSEKPYLYLLKYGVELFQGEKVYMENGRSGQCASDSFTINKYCLKHIASELGLDIDELKYVEGRRERAVEHTKVPF